MRGVPREKRDEGRSWRSPFEPGVESREEYGGRFSCTTPKDRSPGPPFTMVEPTSTYRKRTGQDRTTRTES